MTVQTAPLAVLGFGFLLGMRHALDADHLAAMSTIVGGRGGVWRSAVAGACWGIGHTASLVAVAIGVVGLHAEIPPLVAHGLELGVAVMLVALGGRLLAAVVRGGRVHAHAHAHGPRPHVHPHLHPAGTADHEHVPGRGRSFAVGLVHGLAGSASLMLAVVATIPETSVALAYTAAFGLGSVGGMMAMSACLSVPAVLAAGRFAGADRWLRVGAAVLSVVVGVQLGWDVGADVLRLV